MPEFKPKENRSDANRVALFPLDCSRPQIKQLFTFVNDQAQTGFYDGVKSVVKDALLTRGGPSKLNPEVIDAPAELAVYAAFAAIRLERANPYSESNQSYLEMPIWENPGLSQAAQHIREYYVRAIIEHLFEESPRVYGAEAAAILYVLQGPQHDRLSDGPVRALADLPFFYLKDARRDQIEGTDTNTVRIPERYASQRFLAPYNGIQPAGSIPSLQYDGRYVHVPLEAVRVKLAKYLIFGFNRLVHVAYHAIPPFVFDALERNTAEIDERLRKKDETGHQSQLYAPLYTVTGSHPESSGRNPPSAPDPRLVGVVDAVRSSPGLSFNEYHSVGNLGMAAREYVPPPHRPSLPPLTASKIRGVLSEAAQRYGDETGQYAGEEPKYNDVVRRRSTDDGVEYLLRPPVHTPLYFPPSGDFQHPWEAYERLLHKQATEPLPANFPVNPVLEKHDPSTSIIVNTAITGAHRAAAATPHSERLQTVSPHVTPDCLSNEAESLTQDEITFLTRVGRGMHHLIRDVSLSEGMAHYDDSLDIDPANLVSRDWLEPHPKPRVSLYTLPRERFPQIGLRPLDQEGYSDTVFEKSLHKYAVESLREYLEASCSLSKSHRYYDLWRLNIDSETIESIIADSPSIGKGRKFGVETFNQSRADVIGFENESVAHVGEALTPTKNPEATTRNWDKLAVLGEQGVTTHWLC